MNKKEINEIKSLFSDIDDIGIGKMCGCYVDGNRNIVSTFNQNFLSIEKEEMYKYLEIFQKTLSGTQGKNLIDMTFNPGSEGSRLLESMRQSGLEDDNLNKLFYDKVIETIDCVGGYLILCICQAYDVPGVTDDGIAMEDASDEVYKYILCSICPVGVTKAGLGYYEEVQEFHNLKQDKYVKLPEYGILYPAFNDRSADMDGILYFTKNGDGGETKMLGEFLNVSMPLPAAEQKEVFQSLVKETISDDTEFEVVTAIHENMAEMVQNKKENKAGPVFIGKDDVSCVLKKSGLPEEKVRSFERRYDEEFSSNDFQRELCAANVMPARSKLEVKTPDVVVRINYDKTSLVETRVIDGKKCLVIELGEGLVVNGIPIQ